MGNIQELSKGEFFALMQAQQVGVKSTSPKLDIALINRVRREAPEILSVEMKSLLLCAVKNKCPSLPALAIQIIIKELRGYGCAFFVDGSAAPKISLSKELPFSFSYVPGQAFKKMARADLVAFNYNFNTVSTISSFPFYEENPYNLYVRLLMNGKTETAFQTLKDFETSASLSFQSPRQLESGTSIAGQDFSLNVSICDLKNNDSLPFDRNGKAELVKESNPVSVFFDPGYNSADDPGSCVNMVVAGPDTEFGAYQLSYEVKRNVSAVFKLHHEYGQAWEIEFDYPSVSEFEFPNGLRFAVGHYGLNSGQFDFAKNHMPGYRFQVERSFPVEIEKI